MEIEENWGLKSNSCKNTVPEVGGHLVYTYPGGGVGRIRIQAEKVAVRQARKSHLINYYSSMQLILEGK